MPELGKKSRANIDECDSRLILVAERAIQIYDFSVTTGHRGRNAQETAFRTGHSKADWLESPHNYTPSMAFDAVPYYKTSPHFRWGSSKAILDHFTQRQAVDHKTLKRLLRDYSKEIASFYIMQTFIFMAGRELGILLVNGSDWDSDLDITDQSFDDLGHTELANWRDMVVKP